MHEGGIRMKPIDVLALLRQSGCLITIEGDSLRVQGPLTDDLRQATRQNKPALLTLLRAFTPPVILEPNGEDPLDYRLAPLTGEWRHEPDWWKNPAQPRETYKDRAPCPRCGGTRFWVTICHSEVCEKCHPPRPGDWAIGWITTRRQIHYEPAIS